MINEKRNLRFDLNQINAAINNLNFSLIYQELNDENTQYYLKQLIENIEKQDLKRYLNPTI
jgi:hypothetical protein